VLPEGELHPDLVNRLAREAGKSAQHVLNMCIRALDYCPPVDVTFGEYLRALITADYEVVPDDVRGYRTAFIEAFRRRGIYPRDVRTLSVESLRWREADVNIQVHEATRRLAEKLEELAGRWRITGDRKVIFQQARENRAHLHDWLKQNFVELRIDTGLDWSPSRPDFEIHSVRPARRIRPDGNFVVEMVVEIIQRRRVPLDETAPAGGPPAPPGDGSREFSFLGGCTLLVDIETGRIRYSIYKSVTNANRLNRQRAFLQGRDMQALRALYFDDGGEQEPFAFLHREMDEGVA
jgi:hypothetical protein